MLSCLDQAQSTVARLGMAQLQVAHVLKKLNVFNSSALFCRGVELYLATLTPKFALLPCLPPSKARRAAAQPSTPPPTAHAYSSLTVLQLLLFNLKFVVKNKKDYIVTTPPPDSPPHCSPLFFSLPPWRLGLQYAQE